MVHVFLIGEKKEINSGEIIYNNSDFFKIHSDDRKFYKTKYKYTLIL